MTVKRIGGVALYRTVFGLCAMLIVASCGESRAEEPGQVPSPGKTEQIRILDDDELSTVASSQDAVPVSQQNNNVQQNGVQQPLPSVDERFVDVPKWQGWLSNETKLGDDLVSADYVGFIPLWQDSENLLFAYLRGYHTDLGANMGNFGIGHRSLAAEGTIFTAYAFYDRYWSQTSRSFQQATVGLELKTYEWDFWANGYISENRTDQIGPSYVNSQLIQFRKMESTYYGFDAHVGRLLSAWGENNQYEVRGFVGGFHFDSPASHCPNISGPMVRLEMRVYDLDWFGNGSRLVLGTEYRWDQVRNDSVFAVLGLRIPLGITGPQQQLNPFERRYLDRIQRANMLTCVNRTSRQITLPMMKMMEPPPIEMEPIPE